MKIVFNLGKVFTSPISDDSSPMDLRNWRFLFDKYSFALYLCLTLVFLNGCDDTRQTSTTKTEQSPNIIIILTDDQGYADLGIQNAVDDIHTPNIDRLAETGARMTAGYAAAPQCTPSRAAVLAGRYHQKFGLDDNTKAPFPLTQATLAEKLSANGYRTGMVGKWHLNINRLSETWFREVYAPGSEDTFDVSKIPSSIKAQYLPENRGFHDIFSGYINNFRANFNLNGDPTSLKTVKDKRFRIDVTSDAAVAFIKRHANNKPFFLYVPYFAPHVPLEANENYLSQFPEKMAERRRYALAMLAAVDNGVGRITQTLEQQNISDNTIIFFMSDNGAPLALDKEDVLPVSLEGPYWDGSLNTPWLGEKGMLSEGAIRVPFIVNWKGEIPAGQIYPHPVLSIDASTTAAALAGLDISDMDGINLLPYLQQPDKIPERALFWRFRNQAAVREGKWKYLIAGDQNKYLFDLDTPEHERVNHIEQSPEIAASLHQKLATWAASLKYPGLPNSKLVGEEKKHYEYHFSENTINDPHAGH